MNPLEQLKSIFCDPKGKCCIAGSNEDRAIVDRALAALAQPQQEPVARVLSQREMAEAAKRYTSPPSQRKPLKDEQATKAALWDLAVSKGLVTVHSEQLAPGIWSAHLSVASWIEGHDKACDISTEAAHGIKVGT